MRVVLQTRNLFVQAQDLVLKTEILVFILEHLFVLYNKHLHEVPIASFQVCHTRAKKMNLSTDCSTLSRVHLNILGKLSSGVLCSAMGLE